MSLSAEQKQTLRTKLEEREQYLRHQHEADYGERDSYRELVDVAADAGDASNADLITDQQHARVEKDRDELRAIARALNDLNAEGFGDCIDCGAPIGYDRLLVEPTAQRCQPCQSLHEHNYADAGRAPSL